MGTKVDLKSEDFDAIEDFPVDVKINHEDSDNEMDPDPLDLIENLKTEEGPIIDPEDIKIDITDQVAEDFKRESFDEIKSEGKLYPCIKCDFTSTTPSELTLHNAELHCDEVDTFNCAECDFKTDIMSYLKTHMTQKHGSKRFKCPECPHTTPSKAGMKKHKRRKHSEVRFKEHNQIEILHIMGERGGQDG